MAADFTPEQIAEFQTAFEMFDCDGSGAISVEELQQCLEKLGQRVELSEVFEMVREVDADGTGDVSFGEFLTMMANKFSGEDLAKEIGDAFTNLFDRDGDGYLSAAELKYVMKTLGEDLTDKEVEEMIIEADRDGDGQVSRTEFTNILMMK
eukprot:TRINITY_DN137_c0_g1_i1.p1 TRINITY_DN137_c0_g1~~TRINITY_DN137_c0_g1_i1.p1  ORF type:complete len:151 (+),score=23.59 TRINITY_DN137_c0_g1_i1:53-505(+)